MNCPMSVPGSEFRYATMIPLRTRRHAPGLLSKQAEHPGG
jgi:hypothetical protein